MTEPREKAGSREPPPGPGEYHHFAGFEGDWRDTWWNKDFLELMGQRLRLKEVRAAVDVGSGVGHWGRALLPLLHPEATLVGVDMEAPFVEEAAASAAARGLGGRATYRTGRAEALPLDDASVDLATCQTLLMHVADPRRALDEMQRVLRPGGLVLAAEPNNFAELAIFLSATPDLTIAERLALLELEAVCQRGKQALGEGDSSVAERLPGIFRESGLTDIQAYHSDRCALLVPPYDAPDQRVDLRQWLGWIDAGVWMGAGGTRERAKRLYEAGGGDPAAFEERWALAGRQQQAFKAGALAGTLSAARGVAFYLIAGRKPAS